MNLIVYYSVGDLMHTPTSILNPHPVLSKWPFQPSLSVSLDQSGGLYASCTLPSCLRCLHPFCIPFSSRVSKKVCSLVSQSAVFIMDAGIPVELEQVYECTLPLASCLVLVASSNCIADIVIIASCSSDRICCCKIVLYQDFEIKILLIIKKF